MIHTQAELNLWLPHLAEESSVAVDTEADSLHAYPEKLCLIQISLRESDVLIDPLAGMDLQPLLTLLQGKELILHGADYDLRLLFRTFQFVPNLVFDTMWAARLLGYTEFGLRDLVRQHLGVALEKGPQKMNWARRPLPARMANYAVNDTRYLRPLAELVRAQLKEKGRLEWMHEVCARMIQECSQPKLADADGLWRIKGSDRLDQPGMAVLRELWHWREQEAISANKPPYFILSHEQLVAVAAAVAHGRPAQNLLPHHLHPKRADRLASAIHRALKVPPSQHPQRRRSTPDRLTREQQLEFERLKQIRDARARDLGIDPTLIASKADLVHLARGPEANLEIMAWQRQLLLA